MARVAWKKAMAKVATQLTTAGEAALQTEAKAEAPIGLKAMARVACKKAMAKVGT